MTRWLQRWRQAGGFRGGQKANTSSCAGEEDTRGGVQKAPGVAGRMHRCGALLKKTMGSCFPGPLAHPHPPVFHGCECQGDVSAARRSLGPARHSPHPERS